MMLTQKETSLLNDLQSQEKLCINKYARYERQAQDPQLKALFSSIGDREKAHLQTIQQMLQGTVPLQQGGQQKPQPMNSPTYGASPAAGDAQDAKTQDAFLCQDALSMEKHVSSVYDTSIFEFADPSARAALNAIQTDEQQHGQEIYAYMARNGMYA